MENLKEQYIEALQKTCDEIKANADVIFADISDNMITRVSIEIHVEPNAVVGYDVKKSYSTKFGDEMVKVISQEDLKETK